MITILLCIASFILGYKLCSWHIQAGINHLGKNNPTIADAIRTIAQEIENDPNKRGKS